MTDVLTPIKNLLTNGWTAGNTDGRTPVIDFAMSHKNPSIYDKDYVLAYETNSNERPASQAPVVFEAETLVSVMVKTSYGGWTHFQKVRDEVVRIIRANITGVTGFYDVQVVRKDERDFDLGNVKMFMATIDVRMKEIS